MLEHCIKKVVSEQNWSFSTLPHCVCVCLTLLMNCGGVEFKCKRKSRINGNYITSDLNCYSFFTEHCHEKAFSNQKVMLILWRRDFAIVLEALRH